MGTQVKKHLFAVTHIWQMYLLKNRHLAESFPPTFENLLFLKLNKKYGPDLFLIGAPSRVRLDIPLPEVEAAAVGGLQVLDPTDVHWLYFEEVWLPNYISGWRSYP